MIYITPERTAYRTAVRSEARGIISITSPGRQVSFGARAPEVLRVEFEDGLLDLRRVAQAREFLPKVFDFAHGKTPLVVHCQMGISRSSAVAWVLAARETGDAVTSLRHTIRDVQAGVEAGARAFVIIQPNINILVAADGILELRGPTLETVWQEVNALGLGWSELGSLEGRDAIDRLLSTLQPVADGSAPG